MINRLSKCQSARFSANKWAVMMLCGSVTAVANASLLDALKEATANYATNALFSTSFEAGNIDINKNYYQIEYSPAYKGAVVVSYLLERDKVHSGNIVERPRFYTETALDKKYQTYYSDYSSTGYDRGHVASDASFDWSKASQLSTYTMANIVPMLPGVNRNAWLSVETLERYTATQFPTINVINLIEYNDDKILRKLPVEEALVGKDFNDEQHKQNYINRLQRADAYLKKKQIRIPSGFYKILSNKVHNFKECYYVPNKLSTVSTDAATYLIPCKGIQP